MKNIKRTFIPQEHAERVIIEDDFGNISDHKYHLVVTRETAPGVFEHVALDIDALVKKEYELMAEREELIRKHGAERGHSHPAFQHPNNRPLTWDMKSLMDEPQHGPDEGCKDCE